jgi:hypothetical protein
MRIVSKCIHALLFVLAIFSIVYLQSCTSGDDDEPVVENEDVFINEIYSAGEDWLELYNAGTAAKNISGYFVYDDILNKYVIPANTTIPAKGFLVLICDGTATGLHTNFKLSSDGETVFLETPTKKLIDKAEFPALVDGQSYARYPDGAGAFAITGTTTKGLTNGDAQSPAISDVGKQPLIPGIADAIKISATVKDNTGITAVKLFYSINNAAYTSVAMSLTSNAIYEGTIPAVGVAATVKYYVEAKNTGNKTSVNPADAPTGNYSFIINTDDLSTVAPLVINEFMASNVSCCPDTDGDIDEFDDWIEIYNTGSSAINIAGMHLSDDPADPFKFKVPDTNASKTTIQPGGYLIIWADETKSQGELHASFKLSATGETVGLYYLDGRTIDQKTFATQGDDKSYGRTTDGALTWTTFDSPTRATSN